MGTDIAIMDEFEGNLAELMGVTGGGGGSSLSRVFLQQAPIMGEVEVNGKKLKTEVIPVGAYRVEFGDDTVAYANELNIRVFAMRQQWAQWDSEKKVMYKTVQATDLKSDLKDNKGTFNIGRPGGYIKDFNALSKEMKDLIRAIKHTTLVYGMVELVNPVDEAGEPLDNVEGFVPFIMEIRSSAGRKNLQDAVAAIGRKNLLPLQYTIKLGAETKEKPDGGIYGIISAKLGEKVDVTQEDQETLKNFFKYISNGNQRILDKWEEINGGYISEEDADLVGSIVNVETADE